MFAFTNSKDKISPTVIGAGVKVTGDLRSDSIVQIHGEVQGKVHADTVIIGRGGRVVGKVFAKHLFLHGTIDGPATADSANIFADAKMTGVLTYCKLNITNNDKLECKLSYKRKGNCDVEE